MSTIDPCLAGRIRPGVAKLGKGKNDLMSSLVWGKHHAREKSRKNQIKNEHAGSPHSFPKCLRKAADSPGVWRRQGI